jgi:hypothetical protein
MLTRDRHIRPNPTRTRPRAGNRRFIADGRTCPQDRACSSTVKWKRPPYGTNVGDQVCPVGLHEELEQQRVDELGTTDDDPREVSRVAAG